MLWWLFWVFMSLPYLTTKQCTHYYTVHFKHFYTTFYFLILSLFVNIKHDNWILDDIFINKYILDKCTYCWVTVLCNRAPWWWSKVTKIRRCNELSKYISFEHFIGFLLTMSLPLNCVHQWLKVFSNIKVT